MQSQGVHMDFDSLKQMFDMHIKECDSRDERNSLAITEIKGMFKGIWDAQDDMREKVTNIQVRMALALGGLIVVGKALDYFIAWVHK